MLSNHFYYFSCWLVIHEHFYTEAKVIFNLFVSHSVFLSVCLSVYQHFCSVHLSLNTYVSQFVVLLDFVYIFLSLFLSLFLYVYPFDFTVYSFFSVYLTFCLFFFLYIFLSVYPSFCLSACPIYCLYIFTFH